MPESKKPALTTMAGTRAATKPPKAILAPGQSGPGSQALTDQVQTVLQDVLAALDDSKAEEIVQIDLAGKTSIADVMIIATGRRTSTLARSPIAWSRR